MACVGAQHLAAFRNETSTDKPILSVTEDMLREKDSLMCEESAPDTCSETDLSFCDTARSDARNLCAMTDGDSSELYMHGRKFMDCTQEERRCLSVPDIRRRNNRASKAERGTDIHSMRDHVTRHLVVTGHLRSVRSIRSWYVSSRLVVISCEVSPLER